MDRVVSFDLGNHFNAFVEAQIATGRYCDASDVIRAALRLLEERESRLAAMQVALIEGEDNGPEMADIEEAAARRRGRDRDTW